jgi:hypothetical protein
VVAKRIAAGPGQVAISLAVHEDCYVGDLLESDNKDMCKYVAVLTAVTDSCTDLAKEARTRFFAPLSAYGERFMDEPLKESEAVQRMAAMLPFLGELADFGVRCHAVVGNAVAQLAGLYTDERGSRYREIFKGAHPHLFMQRLANLLAALVTLDLLIASNSELLAHWGQYKRMLEGAALEPELYEMQPHTVAEILMAVTRMEGDIFDGAFLRGCWMQDLQWHHSRGVSEARQNKALIEEASARPRAAQQPFPLV